MIDATRIGFDPLLPWLWVGLLGGLIALVWVIYGLRGGRAWLTRALGATLIGIALANPLRVEENREPLKSVAAVIVDRSASMGVEGRSGIADTVRDDVIARIEASETFEARVIETPLNAAQTDLATSIQSALADTPRQQIAGAILITDGQAHDMPPDLATLNDFGPVHGLIVGNEDEVDWRIDLVSAPSYGIVGETISFDVRVETEGRPTSTIEVSVNGGQRRFVPAFSGQVTRVTVPVDRRGANTVVLSIPEAPNELTRANNLTAVTVSGIRDTLRVLLVTGEPHQGGRAWRDLLKSDPMVDLVHFTILRPPHKQDATPTEELALIGFPTRELFDEKLSEFDLIIFDQYRRRGVLHLRYLDNIAQYVLDGGALLIAAGEPFASSQSLHRTPLASVLPLSPTGEIIEGAFVPALSELGDRHSITAGLDAFSFGPWYRYIEAREVTGDVLMVTPDNAPLLAVDRVGEGRVAELMSDQLWLWARGHEGGGPFADMIRRLVHWMMKEPELEEERLTLEAQDGKLVARLKTLNEQPSDLAVLSPSGDAELLGWTESLPGEFVATIEDPELGLYQARVGDLEAVALNGPAQPLEFADLRSTTDVLQPLADATGGQVMRVSSSTTPELRASRDAGGSNWIGLRDRDAYVVRDSETTNLLPPWLVAGMLFVLFLLAWRREAR